MDKVTITMDSKSLLHATAGAMRAPGAKPLAAELRSPRYSPGMTDPASRIVCRGRDLAEAKGEFDAIASKLRTLLDIKMSPPIIASLRKLFENSNGCEVSISLGKMELSEPTISVTVKVITLQSTIPDRLRENISGMLEGLRFSLSQSPSGKKEYLIGAEEVGIRSSSLPGLLSNLAKVAQLTKEYRTA